MDLCCKVLLLFCCGCIYHPGAIQAADWFVSRHSGSSSIKCGNETIHPCRTINETVARVQKGDVIYIDGTGTSRDPYPCVSEPPKKGLGINVSVSLLSYKTRAFVACSNDGFLFHCVGRSNCSGTIHIGGITFINSSLSFADFSLTAKNCNFVNSTASALAVTFEQSSKRYVDLNGCKFENNSASVLKMNADVMRLTIRNSSFVRNKLNFANKALLSMAPRRPQGAKGIEFNVTFEKSVQFSQNNCTGQSCVEISPGLNGEVALIIENTTFEGNEAKESVLSINGTSKIALHSVEFTRNVGRALKCFDGNSVELNITQGIMYQNIVKNKTDNGGAIYMYQNIVKNITDNGGTIYIRGFKQQAKVFLTRSNFSDNKASGFGGAVAISNASSLFLNVESCSFVSNKAGICGGAIAVGETEEQYWTRKRWLKNASVLIRDTNFTRNILNSTTVSGGGAVAIFVVDMWKLEMIKDIFTENKVVSNEVYGAILALFDHLHEDAILLGCDFVRNFGGTLTLMVLLPLMPQPRMTIQNSTFVDNSGGDDGEISITNVTDIRLADLIFSNNTNFTFSLLNFDNSRYSFKNVTFSNNSCSAWSAIFEVRAVDSPRNTLRLQGTKFLKNYCNTGVVKIAVVSSTNTKLESRTNVTIESSEFHDNSGVIESADGGISITNVADIRLADVIFSDNTNFAFFLSNGNNSRSSFKNVTFSNNSCSAWSAMLEVVAFNSARNTLRLQETKFLKNYCNTGVVRIEVEPCIDTKLDSQTNVTIESSEFHDNSGVTETAVTLVNVKEIRIQNSKFINNFGNTDGSHLRVQLLSSNLRIFNTSFHQTKKSELFAAREQPYNGMLTVTNRGNIKIRDSSFISDPVDYNGLQLIRVTGVNNVDIDESVIVKSSLGSKLFFRKFPHWEDKRNADGFYARTLITTFYFSSQPCPIGTYSIKQGTAEGLTIKNNVTCSRCPSGAVCNFNLSAKPNFWGYPTVGDHVSFTLCPYGYCCPSSNQSCLYDNESYNRSGCQGNRTGFMCGRCKNNFSESLFTARCHPVGECKHPWILAIGFACAAMFALFLVTKPPIFQTLWSNLTWFVPDSKHCENLDRCHGNLKESNHSNGFLKIVFYFYQIAGLLTISSFGVTEKLKDDIVLPLINVLDFKISPNTHWNICPLPGITAMTKVLFQLVGVAAIFLFIALIYLLHSGLNKLRKRQPVFPPSGPYLGAVLETMLLGYSSATGTLMKLLHCKTINQELRWFYNANIKCFQWWQYASIVGIVLYFVPFVFTLFWGSSRLYRRQLSATNFLLACAFPSLYFLATVGIGVKNFFKGRHCHDRFIVNPPLSDGGEYSSDTVVSPSITGESLLVIGKSSSVTEESSSVTGESSSVTGETSVFEVLTAPFHKPKDEHSTGMIHWESVLIGRRFILILVGSFVTHAFLRSVCLSILCVIVLLHHVSRKPFVEDRANFTETISLSTLIVIAMLNVGVASYYSEGDQALGVQEDYVTAFWYTEAILLGLVPVLFILFVAVSSVSQIVRLTMHFVKVTRRLISNRKERQLQKLEDDDEAKQLLAPTE